MEVMVAMSLYKASNGTHGKGDLCHGKKGNDIFIDVPVGTVVKEIARSGGDQCGYIHYPGFEAINETDDRFQKVQQTLVDPGFSKTVELDLCVPGRMVLVAHGGRPGIGNPSFAWNSNPAPRFATKGFSGLTIKLQLELKTIADVGLIGLPNAGKSTLLSKITNAKPEIADYEFTTLNPYLGKIGEILIADIPGLIAGASENKGLGHAFLKHIERARGLCFVIDLSRDPALQYEILKNELDAYDSALLKRKRLIVGNKADLEGAQVGMEQLMAKVEESVKVVPISAMHGGNLQRAIREIKVLAS
ncbi:GTPase Obg [Neolecta irregularis DAH-3]|uniref:GTPase Obg n=1 Tax=Neolecta irregularis (strain DAH-3) TaxID=1198029 RepID=A0A1U7LN00_NEOID|nr:GTPase Obg [Neolecta irregularis DAH-3]|eukprot:OLL23922.1 GTPase Obg [Neolecta irregularis DAH-3]